MKMDEASHTEFISAEIDGIYQNTSIDVVKSLWQELLLIDQKLFNSRNRLNKRYSDSATILITFDEPFLIASIYENDELQEFIQFRARIRDNYLAIRRNLKLIPTPIIYLYSERKTCLTKNLTDNSLILKSGRDDFGYVLIMGNGHSDRYMKTFKSVASE